MSVIVMAFVAGTASADTLQTLRAGNTLVTVNSATPGTIASSVALSGIASGTTLRGIDYRPASPHVLYGLSNVGQLYAINPNTGVAAAVGTPPFPPISAQGFDFNPMVDRIRVITQVGQNVRLNPDTGALAATDGTLAYAATDASARQIPTAAGAAYTNNVAGAMATTLYVIDTRGGLAAARLATQGNLSGTVSPNSGTLFTVGSTGVISASSVGFDISREGVAYATLTNPTTLVTSLYAINLTTGAATLLGALGGNMTYDGLAVQLPTFASNGATANQSRVGAALDGFVGLPSVGVLQLFNGLDGVYVTTGAQSAALQALSPAVYSNLPEMSLNAPEVQETTILRYTRDLRGNAGMPKGSVATLDAAGKVGSWLTGGSRFGHYNQAVDRPYQSTDEVHVLGGLDYRFAATTAVGLFGGYSQTDAKLTRTSSTGRLKSWFGGAYGTVLLGPVYLDAWGSYTDLDWGLSRAIVIGTFSDRTSAQTGGRVWTGGGAAGISLNYGMIEVEPFVAGRYTNLKLDGFDEAGGAAALRVGSFSRVSIRSEVGARVGAKIEAMGVTIRPQARGGWYHEFRGQARTINAVFLASAISAPFAFTTTPLGRNYYNAGGSLTIAGNEPLSIVADYDAQFDDDRQFNNFTIGFRVAL